MYVKIRYNCNTDDESIYECDTLKWSTGVEGKWLLLYKGNQENKFLLSNLTVETEVFVMNNEGKTVDRYVLKP